LVPTTQGKVEVTILNANYDHGHDVVDN